MSFGGGERGDLALRGMSQVPLVNDFKRTRLESIFVVVDFAEFF